VQLAVLDPVGVTRGADTNEIGTLQRSWQSSDVRVFSTIGELEAWEKAWPDNHKSVVKIIYDKSAGEIRVVGHRRGKAFGMNLFKWDQIPAAHWKWCSATSASRQHVNADEGSVGAL
jgi:hypothetical protein